MDYVAHYTVLIERALTRRLDGYAESFDELLTLSAAQLSKPQREKVRAWRLARGQPLNYLAS
jgi:hypothetical protein